MTTVYPSLAVCTAHVRRHGSVSVRRAGWAAFVTKVSVIRLPRHSYLNLPPILIYKRSG